MTAPRAVAAGERARGRRRTLCFAALGALFGAAFLAASGVGAVGISAGEALSIAAAQFGLRLPWAYDSLQEHVLLAIRLPRVCLGALAGAALAVAGAALQGLFRNPLADPGLIGVSSGAALAAAAAIVLAEGAPGFVLPLAAFAGGLSATLAVYRIASRGGRTDTASMLLAGIAVNAIASAGIGWLIFASDDEQLRDLNFWMLGSLGGADWGGLLSVAPAIALPIALLALLARPLDALLLGETEAWHLGVNVEWVKRGVVVFAALAASATVALTGVIGFVGLVAPHLVRLTVGPEHRTLLPAAILLGAALLLAADLGARTLVLPAELPIGILTSLIGGPFFLWLLIRRGAALRLD